MGKPTWPFNEHKNLHIDNEQHIHTRSKNYDLKSDYDLKLDLLAQWMGRTNR